MQARPPSRLIQAVETSGSRGSGMRGEANDPVAHMTAAPTQASSASSVASPCGLTRMATPAKPTRTAPMLRAGTRSPLNRRSRITHSGIEATSSAASPEGTFCSATLITALAPGSISPTKPAASSSLRVGRMARRPRRAASTGRTIAATSTNRAPAPNRGGIVSTIRLIAR